jgi:hypothetical protein
MDWRVMPSLNPPNGFGDTLVGEHGLRIDQANILDLFDDFRAPGSQLQEISEFLAERTESVPLPENLFIYYVGHGLFTEVDRKYCLAVRFTDRDHVGFTAIRGQDLAEVIRARTLFLRRFIILDCCFAGAIQKEFLSAPAMAVGAQMLEALPQRGTTLLCAASSEDVALAPQEIQYTMFTRGLIQALELGAPNCGPQMSISELSALVQKNLRREYPDRFVRPEVHNPDMRDGDISDLPIFPNPAWSIAGKQRKAESKRFVTAAEVAARLREVEQHTQPFMLDHVSHAPVHPTGKPTSDAQEQRESATFSNRAPQSIPPVVLPPSSESKSVAKTRTNPDPKPDIADRLLDIVASLVGMLGGVLPSFLSIGVLGWAGYHLHQDGFHLSMAKLLRSPQYAVSSAFDDFKSGNAAEAVVLLDWATLKGSWYAESILGEMLLKGEKVPPNPQRGLQLYLDLANKGNAQTMNEVGILYYCGVTGIPPDPKQSLYWFQRGAAAGNKSAQANLASMQKGTQMTCKK